MIWLRRIAAGMIGIAALGYAGLWWLFATASVTTHGDVDLGAGNLRVPSERTPAIRKDSELTRYLIDSWAAKSFLDWQSEGKVNMPRILLAKLAAGVEVDEVNEYLRAAHVWGTVGSTGPWHPTGDYDFTLAGLCLLLYTFGNSPELLYPDTVDHIVNVLMSEDGGTPVEYTPRLLGLPLRDTENHILMTEGSRYLKNRWLQLHGNTDPRYDNEINGLEAFLLEHLGHMEKAGFHEYNSRPYIGYTLTALLNLQSFAGPKVAAAAVRILDRANWEYALGSLGSRRFPPFRRQPRRAADTDLDGDYHTAMIRTWMSLQSSGSMATRLRSGDHQALWVAFTSYRLPDETVAWIEQKPRGYFVRMGHGHDGSPEIYSGAPGFLISAGGVARDRFNQAVARPTTLMLNDDSNDLSQLLQVSGRAEDFREWNNTGVYERFAVAQQVSVPQQWAPTQVNGRWTLYSQSSEQIVVYADEHLALFYVVPQSAVEPDVSILSRIRAVNPEARLTQRFVTLTDQAIHYDVNANTDTWVVEKVVEPAESGNTSVEIRFHRNFSTWPLLQDQQRIERPLTAHQLYPAGYHQADSGHRYPLDLPDPQGCTRHSFSATDNRNRYNHPTGPACAAAW